MKSLFLMAALSAFVLCALSYDDEFWGRVNNFHPVASVSFSRVGSKKRSVQPEKRLTMRKTDGSILTFRAIEYSPYSPNAKVRVPQQGKPDILKEPNRNTYKGVGTAHRNLRFILHDDGTVSGAYVENGVRHVFDPVETHKPFMSKEHRKNAGKAEYLIIPENAVAPGEPVTCGHESHKGAATNFDSDKKAFEQIPSVAPLSPPPTGCPQGATKQILQVVGADASFIAKFSGDTTAAEAYITQAWMDLNVYYEQDFNTHVTIDELLMGTSGGWNSGCPAGAERIDQIGTKLDQARDWKGANRASSDLFHVMTNCYPSPGTIGLAGLGVVCRNTGSGVSNWLSSRASAHRVVGHEMGHNFDCPHSNQFGLMHPSVSNDPDPLVERFARDSQTDACTFLGQVTCLKSYDSGCTRDCTNKECGPSNCPNLNCGSCTGTDTCENGVCTACPGVCPTGAECGPDSCGHVDACGTCASGSVCDSQNKCYAPTGSENVDVTNVLNTERIARGQPTVTWDDAIHQHLFTHAETCVYSNPPSHSSMGGGALRFNIGGSGSNYKLENTIRDWIDYKQYWDCPSNTDTAGQEVRAWYYRCLVTKTMTKFACVSKLCGSSRYVYCGFDDKAGYPNERPFPANECATGGCAVTPNNNVCTDQGRVCGDAFDGCNTVSCGTCSNSRDTCDANGKCVCTPVTCSAEECGVKADGCGGTVTCTNTCGTGKECSSSNLCVDSPPPPPTDAQCAAFCTAQSRECGSVDECPNYQCGVCTGGDVCSSYQCRSCSGCDTNAECDANFNCVCLAGYTGDGTTCTVATNNVGSYPTFTQLDANKAGDWEILKFAGTAQSTDSIVHTGNSMDCILWDNTDAYPTATVRASAKFLKTSSTGEIGFVVGYGGFSATAGMLVFVKRVSSSQVQLAFRFYFNVPGSTYGTWTGANRNWADGEWKDLRVEASGDSGKTSYAITLDGYTSTFTLNGAPYKGHIGFCSNAGLEAQDLAISDFTTIQYTIAGCPTKEYVRNRLIALLGLTSSQLDTAGIFLTQQGCTSNKRQAGATTTITANIAGSPSLSSTAAAAKFQSLIASGAPGASNAGIISSSVGVTGTAITAGVPAGTAAITGATAGGLSTGAIAGIAVGAIAGVALLGAAVAGVVIVAKKKNDGSESSPKPTEMDEKDSYGGGKFVSLPEEKEDAGDIKSQKDERVEGGVNILPGPKRPDGPSITARNQNVVVKSPQ